jgi:hypothetical protein
VIAVESISFNHDSTSATNDALNIRRNATGWVTVPEWRQGVCFNPEDSPAAYASQSVRGNTVTIQALFSCTDPNVTSVEVRTLDNVVSPPGATGCLGWLTRLIQAVVRILTGNILGEVAPTQITFVGGQSGPVTLTLSGTLLDSAPVGIHTTEWRWQYRFGAAPWTDIAITQHRVYMVLGEPTEPWQQAPYNPGNLQLPWTDALDIACRWSALATTSDAVMAGVTRAVYALGPGTITYDCPGGGSTHYSNPQFDCSAFLDRLHGGFGLGQYVNCTDCATIVAAFSNVLGADLWESRMGWGFALNELLAIGSSTWQTACDWGSFRYHEVAWAGACTENDNVWDACLQVDGDADPATAPHTALLPTGMRFGNPGDLTYRDRLAAPAGRATCAPQPTTRLRRAVQ